jgi:hypothetical protein
MPENPYEPPTEVGKAKDPEARLGPAFVVLFWVLVSLLLPFSIFLLGVLEKLR